MPEPYRTATEPPRRRIHVPGVLAIHTRKVPALVTPRPAPAGRVHYLRTGPAIGYQVSGSIEDWKSEAYLLRRDSLTEEMRRAHDLLLPEEMLDADRWPLVHRAARASALIATDEARFAALLAEGARGYFVGGMRVVGAFAFSRTMSDVMEFSLEQYGWEQEPTGIVAQVGDQLGDRFLREASGGEIDDAMVSLAVELANAAEDEWTAQSWERLLAPVMDPTDEDRQSAAAIARAIDEAPEDADEVEVPIYGLARRVRLPALVRETEGPVARIPPRSVWLVENVEPEPDYGPAPPPPERAPAHTPEPAPSAMPPAAPARASGTGRLIAAVVLVAGIALLLALIASR